MENKMFKLVHVRELASVFNRDVNLESTSFKDCQMEYLVAFQHQQGNVAVGLHVKIRYVTPDNRVVFDDGATFVACIEGWNDMKHEADTLRTDEKVKALVAYGLSFVSGMIFRNNSGTVLNSFVAPYIHIDRIMPDVIFEELPSKETQI